MGSSMERLAAEIAAAEDRARTIRRGAQELEAQAKALRRQALKMRRDAAHILAGANRTRAELLDRADRQVVRGIMSGGPEA